MHFPEENGKDREKRNDAFLREELGPLLRLFTSLGLTVTLGIAGFFWLGVYLDGKIAPLGLAPKGTAGVVFLLAGLGLSLYWAYLAIARHLEKSAPVQPKEKEAKGKKN